MAIQLTDKIHTVSADIDTTNRGSAQANAGREAYTLQDVSDLIGGSGDTNLATSDLVQTGTNVIGVICLPVGAGQSYKLCCSDIGADFPMLKLNVDNTVASLTGSIKAL